jgi:HTH-type transcriptional regulator, global nitrogen regulator NrpRI
MSFEVADVERKITSILKVLDGIQQPMGSRLIAQRLNNYGIELSERAVRYHLKLMDIRGLTELVGNREGRTITEKGRTEIKKALVKEKVGYAITRIELLAFRTDFDYRNKQGIIPVNISLFPRSEFNKALLAMKPAFDGGYCVSQLVAVIEPNQKAGDFIVPEEKIGLVTICSAVINGALLKAGIPMDSKFSGILQIVEHKPKRFIEIIHYNGCSLDPSEIFIRARMTSVTGAFSTGNGEILANFREIPAFCMPVAERVLEGLEASGVKGVLVKGDTSQPTCEVPVDLNRVGLVLIGGLNPVAAAQEVGIEAENHSMSAMMDYQRLVPFTDLLSHITPTLSQT